MKNHRSVDLQFQKLEDRVCLTVSTMLTDSGSLLIYGNADGQVDIVGIDVDTFEIFDNSQLVGTISGVTQDVRVRLDQNIRSVPHDDVVHIDLNDAVIDKVFGNLGHGDDSMLVSGNQSIRRIMYRGGHGSDSLEVSVAVEQAIHAHGRGGDDTLSVSADARHIFFLGGIGNDVQNISADVHAEIVHSILGLGENSFTSDATVDRLMSIRGGMFHDAVDIGGSVLGVLNVNLGHGDNNFQLRGTVDGDAFIRGGNGVDTVMVAEDAAINGHAGIVLAHGNNEVDLNGFFGRLFAQGGRDNDRIVLSNTSHILHRTGIVMGHGDNHLAVNGRHGDDEGLNAKMFVLAGRDNDELVFGEDISVSGHVLALLGDGDNDFSHAGTIEGNLSVFSKNIDDNFVVTGTVLGATTLEPGQQGQA